MGSIERKDSSLSVLLLCVYIIVWYLQLGKRIDFLGTIRIELIIGVILIFLLFIRPQERSTFENPLKKYILLYFLCLLIQIPFSHAIGHSWTIFIDRIVKFAMMAVFIASFCRTVLDIKLVLAAYLLACFKMGQEGFIGWWTGSLVWQNQGIMRLHGVTPLYEHPNSFSGMAIGVLPFVYYLLPLFNRFVKLFLITLAVFSAIIILFSGSRTAYVACFGLIFYLFLKSKSKKKAVVVLIAIMVTLITVIPDEYTGRFESIFASKEERGGSSNKRIEILEDAVYIFIQHPFGVGVQAFPTVRDNYFGRQQDTHNLYLEILTNLGVQGFIVFSLLIYKMFSELSLIRKNCLRLMLHQQTGVEVQAYKDYMFIHALASAFSAFIFTRLCLGLFGMDLYEIYWWFACGFIIAMSKYMNEQVNSRLIKQ